MTNDDRWLLAVVIVECAAAAMVAIGLPPPRASAVVVLLLLPIGDDVDDDGILRRTERAGDPAVFGDPLGEGFGRRLGVADVGAAYQHGQSLAARGVIVIAIIVTGVVHSCKHDYNL